MYSYKKLAHRAENRHEKLAGALLFTVKNAILDTRT